MVPPGGRRSPRQLTLTQCFDRQRENATRKKRNATGKLDAFAILMANRSNAVGHSRPLSPFPRRDSVPLDVPEIDDSERESQCEAELIAHNIGDLVAKHGSAPKNMDHGDQDCVRSLKSSKTSKAGNTRKHHSAGKYKSELECQNSTSLPDMHIVLTFSAESSSEKVEEIVEIPAFPRPIRGSRDAISLPASGGWRRWRRSDLKGNGSIAKELVPSGRVSRGTKKRNNKSKNKRIEDKATCSNIGSFLVRLDSDVSEISCSLESSQWSSSSQVDVLCDRFDTSLLSINETPNIGAATESETESIPDNNATITRSLTADMDAYLSPIPPRPVSRTTLELDDDWKMNAREKMAASSSATDFHSFSVQKISLPPIIIAEERDEIELVHPTNNSFDVGTVGSTDGAGELSTDKYAVRDTRDGDVPFLDKYAIREEDSFDE